MSFLKAWFQAAVAAVVLLTAGIASPRLRSYLRLFAREVGVARQPAGPFPVRRADEVANPAARGGASHSEPPQRRSADGLPTSSIALPDLESVEGNVSLLELAVIARLVRAHQPRTLWEIGSFDGRTTRALAANAPDGAMVHTLDLQATAAESTTYGLEGVERKFVHKPVSGARFLGTPEEARITQHFGDSARFDFTPWAGQVDFVFVDGSHAGPYVRSDTARAWELTMGRRAVIVWHDYGEWPGVTATLDSLAVELSGAYRVAGTTLVVWERGP